jgi:hypothetical protein
VPETFWSNADRQYPHLASVLGGVQFDDPLLEQGAQCGDVDVAEGEIDIAVAGRCPSMSVNTPMSKPLSTSRARSSSSVLANRRPNA